MNTIVYLLINSVCLSLSSSLCNFECTHSYFTNGSEHQLETNYIADYIERKRYLDISFDIKLLSDDICISNNVRCGIFRVGENSNRDPVMWIYKPDDEIQFYQNGLCREDTRFIFDNPIKKDGEYHHVCISYNEYLRFVYIDDTEYYYDDTTCSRSQYEGSTLPLYMSGHLVSVNATIKNFCLRTSDTALPTPSPTAAPTTSEPTEAPTPEPTKEACNDDTTNYNLLFVVDGSGSVGLTNYELTIDFIINLIEYDVNDIAKLAVLSYSFDNDIVYRFLDEQNDDRQLIIQKLEEEKNDFANSSTQTYNALLNGLKQFRNYSNSTQNNLLLLFTDGKPTGTPVCDSNNYQFLTDYREFNIRVVMIGITSSFNKAKVSCIANNGDIYEIADFTSSEFESIESDLRNILCPEPECDNDDDQQFESGAKSHFKSITDDCNLIDTKKGHIGYYKMGLLLCILIIVLYSLIVHNLLNKINKYHKIGYIKPQYQTDNDCDNQQD